VSAWPGPGWYPDPSGRHARRWWDGRSWTTWVLDRPPAPALRPPGVHSGALAAAGAVAGLVLSVLASAAWVGAGGSAGSPFGLLVSEAGLWAGLGGACVAASRRHGTGRVLADFAVALRPRDLGVALAASVGGRLAAGLVSLVVVQLGGRRFSGSNAGAFLPGGRRDALTVGVVAFMLVVGAPFVEELFFRGLVQSSLRARLGPGPAVALQAAVFGLAHLNPSFGLANVSIVAGVAAFGLLQGVVRETTGRLGPTMASHALFNAAALALLLSGGPGG
jgi:membrane protease YdiL (CAAX protease family)